MTSRLEQLDQELCDLGIDPDELVERFSRASGPGGQHVNRSATAVQLQHPPSGLEVRAEGERSQLRNRIAAREQLIARVKQQREEQAARQQAERERRRRRNRRPSPAARARNVERKRRRGDVKRLRGKVRRDD